MRGKNTSSLCLRDCVLDRAAGAFKLKSASKIQQKIFFRAYLFGFAVPLAMMKALP
jgi:hypothetical protein